MDYACFVYLQSSITAWICGENINLANCPLRQTEEEKSSNHNTKKRNQFKTQYRNPKILNQNEDINISGRAKRAMSFCCDSGNDERCFIVQ